LRARDNLEHPNVYERIMDLQELGWGSMDWIDLAHDRNRWQALVNVVMNIPAP